MGVVVACKDALMRDGLVSLLTKSGIRVASFNDGLKAPKSGAVQILLVLPDGFSAKDWTNLKSVRAENPRLRVVVVVSGGQQPPGEFDLRLDRADGGPALVEAVRGLGATVSHSVQNQVSESLLTYGPRRLSPREIEVAQYVAQGFGNRRISQALALREQSVKNLVSSLMRKLNCENRTQIALKLAGGASST